MTEENTKPENVDNDIQNRRSQIYGSRWFIWWRTQIQVLMSGSPDNHVAALMLMFPCMDRVYTLCNPDNMSGDPKDWRGYTPKMLKYFFEKPPEVKEEEYNKAIKVASNDLVNALKHDAFIREGVVLKDTVHQMENGSVVYPYIPYPISFADGKARIAPTAFWNTVRDRIDKFYLRGVSPSDDPESQ